MAETEALNRKKRCRNGHRSSTKRVISSVKECLMSVTEKSQLTPHIAKLTQQRTTLETKLQVLQELDKDILALVSDEDIELEIEQADIMQENIQSTVIEINMCLEEHKLFIDFVTASATNVATESNLAQSSVVIPPENNLEAPVSTDSAVSTSSNTNVPQSNSTTPTQTAPDTASTPGNQTNMPTVKLPKLNLKRFRGDPTAWSTFWDMFESSVHNNPTLSSIDKFNYLSSLLESTAADSIAGLTLTNANYEEAINILKKRFGNKQLAINKHMNTLLNLDPVTSNHNLKGLRTLYDTVESHIRALNSLGVHPSSYGNLLCSMLMNKIPQELRIRVSREVKEDIWDLEHLLKLIGDDIEARERACGNTTNDKLPHNPFKGHGKPPSAAALHTGGTPPSCTYCQQQHTSNSCTTVSNITARVEILKKSGRCFLCLKKNHLSRDCNSKSRCYKCSGKHHISICTKNSNEKHQNPPANIEPREQSGKPPKPKGQTPPNPQATSGTQTLFVSSKTPVLLQTAQATILPTTMKSKGANVRLILDSGSQRSYITSRARDSLRLPTEHTETMLIKTFGSEEEKLTTCDSVNFILESHHDQTKLSLSAFVVPKICEPLQHQLTLQAHQSYRHLNDLVLADRSMGEQDSEVDILIGCDQYWQIVTGEVRSGMHGPTAINTILGWVLSGPVENHQQSSTDHSVNVSTTHVLRLGTSSCQLNVLNEGTDRELRRFWDLESLGISREEKSVAEDFTSTIAFKEGRYEVKLPWKEQHQILPDNYEMSCKRLKNLVERLQREPEILREYDTVIKNQLSKGIVETVNKEDVGEVGRVHYIPHHAVIRRDKETTKLRIVYDASAKTSGPSLNDCLYTGPTMTQNIMDIILRFRSHKVAFTSDIEKAFLMIAVSEADRDVLRFLWFDDVWSEQPEIIILRFTRVVFGVSSSPFLLNATINHHIEQYRAQDPAFVERFLRSIYVDDLNSGGNNDYSAYTLYKKSRLRLAEGGFNLRKFVTNSPELMKKIEGEEELPAVGKPKSDSQLDKLAPEAVNEENETYARITLGAASESSKEERKIIGVTWNYAEDNIVFDISNVAELAAKCKPTKRNIVRLSAKFYDPLGFMSPITIQFKILFQELCEGKVTWDDEIPQDIKVKWNKLVTELQRMNRIVLSRCYFRHVSHPVLSCTIHGFCDASKSAYAAVTYLVVNTAIGAHVRFLAAKTRVAPLEVQSIPRLELLSCLILARLVKNVQEALREEINLEEPIYWTDSKVAQFWITNDKEWKQFVQNRVMEIRSLTSANAWRHCPGRDNPADIPSRGIKPTELETSKLWSSGPEWLTEPQAYSHQVNAEVVPPEECLVESRSTKGKAVSLVVNVTTRALNNIIKIEDFGSLARLLHVTAYVLRFVRETKAAVTGDGKPVEPTLTAEEIESAKLLWVREMQRHLPEKREFDQLKAQFGLYTDDEGIWRCGGRLERANLPPSTRHPILLDKDHYLASLIVYSSHRRVMHNGVKETLTEIRSQYWIVRGRQFVRKLLGRCSICRRFEGKPYQAPPTPPLPEFRMKEAPPFTATGVDFLGPMYVRMCENSQKVWICLYTCCVIRAVHLDIVPNLTSESFMRSFRRFTARRGIPTTIVSDNGGTFKSASREIRDILRHPDVKRFFTGMKVTWSFNLAKAPWWGGLFERLVKSTKRCLKKTIGGARLTYEELLTVVAEVEMILNSRPLSYVSTEDLEEPLTPSHLLTGRRLLSLPDKDSTSDIADQDFSLDEKELSRRMKHLSTLMNHFWKRWREEYLVELRNAHRIKLTGGSRTISVGDVVVVHDESQPRGLWRLAKVDKLIIGNDGNARGAVVKVSSKGKRPSTLRRPVQLLYPLEINAEMKHDETEVDRPAESVTQPEGPRVRSRRAAAIRADEQRRNWIKELEE
ncbi:uncharacterized protein LOC114521021 [Dendronephthya gigantea]|uniref:uncharacterized protein LOC114521021 n=1 Tax=Dendronephthya gigantea TaxID=151771 RepID=UPI00106B1194|nr:uncharacterized protein LOC114521021 [Dendronephthya gigantea]